MPRYVFVPDAAPPPPSAHYSHAVEAQGFLHVTGQLPIDPDDPVAPVPDGIEAQTELVFLNLLRIVDAAGYSLENTVFARIYLTRFEEDYAGLNGVYHRYFEDPARMPARTTVGVARLGREARVEIDLVLSRA